MAFVLAWGLPISCYGRKRVEWLDAVGKLVPIFGAVGALAIAMLIWEKIEHAKTREELKRCNDKRIAEAVALTVVIAAANESSNARDDSQQELARAFQTLTTTLQLTQVGSHLLRQLQQ